MIHLAGSDPVLVLVQLHAASEAVGMGIYVDLRRNLTLAEAAQYLERKDGQTLVEVDYVYGRPIKVNFIFGPDGTFKGLDREQFFERDNGSIEEALTRAAQPHGG